ncbi:MAG TPA: response regulator transcription factor, partial [Paenalcaligenes sp.]|nr:response regulator transcription factor [Paenalcaligenes sp.]
MTRILLVDDHTIFRDGLKRLLHEESDLKVVAEAADGKEALTYLRALEQNDETLDLVLLDINMKGRSG